ncbi:AraC family transcriptional regulator [Clostridiaceae bacterium]|nr:AraC family transcriptional regulator [Clostridiaceae bacterium]
MHSAKEYIEEHYHEPISIKDICRDLGLSESYVSHTFKDMLGYSPMQYALRCKIGEAQTLLISTDYSITEIARMVGFDAQSHFNQRFIKDVGISPSKFRKNCRNR